MRRTSIMLVFATILISVPAIALAQNQAASAPPMHEPISTYFDNATLEFRVPNQVNPIKIGVELEHSKLGLPLGFHSIQIFFDSQSITVDRDSLADIATPDLTDLSVSVLKSYDGKTIIVVDLIDQSFNCAKRTLLSCGVVEFVWTVGERVAKRDERIVPH